MHRLEHKLIAVFLAATVAPLLITLWLSLSLLDRSLALSPTKELDETTVALRDTGRELYLRACDSLKRDAEAHRTIPRFFPADSRSSWPHSWAEFWTSPDSERFVLTGGGANQIDYLQRRSGGIAVYSAPLGGVRLDSISSLYARARAILDAGHHRDLRRGFFFTLLFLAASIWLASFAFLIYWAHRLSRPIRRLTAGLAQVAAGNFEHRVPEDGSDESTAAIRAFNDMACQLQQSRERLVWITRLESWQALARKTAHELKNSLTPIRLTIEEVAARSHGPDTDFLRQAAQIVVDEVTGLERRVRAFSELASEPPLFPRPLDLNSIVEERIALLRPAHPGVAFPLRLSSPLPLAAADEDLLKGILTNLLVNAAEAAQPGGAVLCLTGAHDGVVFVEVHDSGPGLSGDARKTLFEPSISFKPGGMGLGLSIARKSAVRLGGEIFEIPGELGGAAFRVLLPAAPGPPPEPAAVPGPHHAVHT
jgi:two-component system nitrogen regulation sensor histidine kinase NtrY